uniref:Uncharacterized protein n=1 Tax=Lepeophtheirus salmonis TaxID=72036 RepID=A0A0K2V755_LEPSM
MLDLIRCLFPYTCTNTYKKRPYDQYRLERLLQPSNLQIFQL